MESITTPPKVETRLGTLEFFDGFPDEDTVEKVYDNLDFMRGVEVFLNTMPGASLYAMRTGFRSIGVEDNTCLIFESLLDSRTILLMGNTDTVYVWSFLDLNEGPVVLETPPNALGVLNDMWYHYIADFGNAGPDGGEGGRFLVLPPNYDDEVPEGYYVYRSPTYGVMMMGRGFSVEGDPRPATENIREYLRVYPLTQAADPPETKLVNGSGLEFNTVHANTYKFYEEINALVQEEPAEAMDPETLGLLAAIGIEKGKPFEPDTRMRQILEDAVATANATARAISFRPRSKDVYHYPGESYWTNPLVTGHEFKRGAARVLDARTMFFYLSGVVTPAMAVKMVGVGSQYAGGFVDANGEYLDGGKSYRLHLPPNPPANRFWSVTLYDLQTRSMLQTDNPFPSLSSQTGTVEPNPDGSYDIHFGPKVPPGKENNWLQTIPGKGWCTLLRLYGPLEPWFDKTWRPGEIEEVTNR